MKMDHPGGIALTEKAITEAGLKEGSKVLDIGCAEGDTVAYLLEKGMEAEGIDKNLSKIYDGKQKHEGIKLSYGDGEFLDGYLSYTFDGVTMEHTLSLINMPDESLHEVYCVLKKGGKLIVTDLYDKDPDPKQVKAIGIEADRRAHIQKQKGDCEEQEMKFLGFRFEGAFFKDELIRQMEETGFHVLSFEDESEALEEYIKDSGLSEEEALAQLSPILKTEVSGKKRNIGSFLLIAQKPVM